MHLFQNNKKLPGETLVEVVVSLGIIIFVFSSVLSLVVVSINLNLSARNRNEAINLAANRLNNFYVDGSLNDFSDLDTIVDSGTCVVDPPRDLGLANAIGTDAATCPTISEDTLKADTDQMCDYIVIIKLGQDAVGTSKPDEISDATRMLTDQNFAKVESHVKYYVRGLGIQEYVVTKLMRLR
jgi:type II secretory pathway pseudopilin PulG